MYHFLVFSVINPIRKVPASSTVAVRLSSCTSETAKDMTNIFSNATSIFQFHLSPQRMNPFAFYSLSSHNTPSFSALPHTVIQYSSTCSRCLGAFLPASPGQSCGSEHWVSPSFLLFFNYVYVCVSACECVQVTGQKMVLGLLELKYEPPDDGAGNWTRSSGREAGDRDYWAISPALPS